MDIFIAMIKSLKNQLFHCLNVLKKVHFMKV